MLYDTIVVGAGPAGASAARRLAQGGLRVLLLERARLPRYKPCGGGLTAKAITRLDFDISPVVEAETHRVVMAYGGTAQVEHTLGGTSVTMVMRDRFDALLAEKASEAGAELRDAVRVEAVEPCRELVTVRTANESLRARYVIGADGATGPTARCVGLMRRRHDGAAIEAEIEAPTAVLERWRGAFLLDFGVIPWGYGWVFPKAEHLSVGVGTYTPSGKIKLREHLERFIAARPELRGPMTTKGHLIPLGGRSERLDRGRVALAGDAGATVDPFLGEGIAYAIHSGQSAADAILAACQRDAADLSAHTRRVNAEINGDFAFARFLTNLFYRVPELMFQLFVVGAAAVPEISGILTGGGGYRQLLTMSLLRMPTIAWRAIRGT